MSNKRNSNKKNYASKRKGKSPAHKFLYRPFKNSISTDLFSAIARNMNNDYRLNDKPRSES